MCVCAYAPSALYRCKTSFYCRGVWHSRPTTHNEAVDMSETGNVASFLYLQLYGYNWIYNIIYIYRHWAHLSRSWGGHIFYRCWFIWSTSTLIIRLYIMYIFILSINCWCFCTSHAFHNQIRNDSSEQVCDSCWICHGGMNPSRNTFPGRNGNPRLDRWIYIFQPNNLSYFSTSHPSVVVWQLAAVPGSHLFFDWHLFA